MREEKRGPVTVKFFAGKKPRVFGHRGSAGTCPENTLLSFDQAKQDGADILEMDLRLTRDKQAIVWHDSSVDRTTDGSGLVKDLTATEIGSLDCGWSFRTAGSKQYSFRGQRLKVASFEDVLQRYPGMPINVEVKDRDFVLVDETIRLLQKYNRLHSGDVLVVVNSKPCMQRLRARAPSLLTSHTTAENVRFVIEARMPVPPLFRAQGDAIQLPLKKRGFELITPGLVRAAHRQRLELHVWTVNDESRMRWLLQMGVDGIFTDFPGKLRRIVDESK